MAEKILVTGASGFIAKHIVLQLLEAGYQVRGSVRSDKREAEVRAAMKAHLTDVNLDEMLEFVRLDLSSDEGWDAALQGVDALMHTASPVTFEMPKDEAELIAPAVDGTVRALRAAKAAEVGRVILTSSVSAIIAKDKDIGKEKFDENDWTDVTNPKASPYDKSKTLAEEAAWKFVSDAEGIDLTVINPGMVLGAPLDNIYGASLALIERVMSGKDMALPNKGFPIVHVRDVATMHVRALQKPETAGERIISAAGWFWFKDISRILKREFPYRKVPTMVAPNFLIRFLAKFDKELVQIVPSLGQNEAVSNAKAIAMLDMSFIDPETSLVEAARVVDRQMG